MKQNYKAISIWLTGISGSGKTTIAKEIYKRLKKENFSVVHFDGDVVRNGLNSDLKFSLEDRMENIRRIAEISKLLLFDNIITINSFISPTELIRKKAQSIIGSESFFQIYVDSTSEQCESNDVKGLYKKARRGEIKDFTGIDSPYETPLNSDFTITTKTLKEHNQIDECISLILKNIKINK
jgi:adenylylsulfate kinase